MNDAVRQPADTSTADGEAHKETQSSWLDHILMLSGFRLRRGPNVERARRFSYDVSHRLGQLVAQLFMWRKLKHALVQVLCFERIPRSVFATDYEAVEQLLRMPITKRTNVDEIYEKLNTEKRDITNIRSLLASRAGHQTSVGSTFVATVAAVLPAAILAYAVARAATVVATPTPSELTAALGDWQLLVDKAVDIMVVGYVTTVLLAALVTTYGALRSLHRAKKEERAAFWLEYITQRRANEHPETPVNCAPTQDPTL